MHFSYCILFLNAIKNVLLNQVKIVWSLHLLRSCAADRTAGPEDSVGQADVEVAAD